MIDLIWMLILHKICPYIYIALMTHPVKLYYSTWHSYAARTQCTWWCLWIVIYSSFYKDHWRNCPKALTQCPYGCGATILNEDRVSHAESCPKKPVVCRLCQEAITVDESSSGCPPLVSPPPSHYNMKMHDLWQKMSMQITACKVCTCTTCVLTSLITIVCFSLLHYIQEHYQSCVAFTKSEPVVCPDCSVPLLNENDVSISFIDDYILQHVLMWTVWELYGNALQLLHCTRSVWCPTVCSHHVRSKCT